MKKLLGISLIAILTAGSAFAVDPVTPNTNVATTSYVQGAFNQLQEQVGGKQEKLMAGETEVNSEVLTEIRPLDAATDTNLVTERAVRAAIDDATGSDERIGEITSLNTDLQSGEDTTVVSAINKLDTKVGSGDLSGIVGADDNNAANLTEAVHLAYEKADGVLNIVQDKLANGEYEDIKIGTVPVVTTASAQDAVFSPRDGSGFGEANNIKDALNNLDTRVKQMEGFVLYLYGDYSHPDQPTAYVKPNGNIVDSIE